MGMSHPLVAHAHVRQFALASWGDGGPQAMNVTQTSPHYIQLGSEWCHSCIINGTLNTSSRGGCMGVCVQEASEGLPGIGQPPYPIKHFSSTCFLDPSGTKSDQSFEPNLPLLPPSGVPDWQVELKCLIGFGAQGSRVAGFGGGGGSEWAGKSILHVS